MKFGASVHCAQQPLPVAMQHIDGRDVLGKGITPMVSIQ